VSEPKAKPSEKITCPWCGAETKTTCVTRRGKVYCRSCDELFYIDHARLAVQHARLVEARKRPWAKRAEELFEREGPYADYAAWCEWLEEALCRTDLGRDMHEVLTESTTTEMTALYALMCDLADATGEDG